MKLKLFLLCHSLNAEKFEFYYTFQDTEFSNGIFSFHSISLQFSAPENPSVHPVIAATAEKRNNNKIGWECKRWWWQWKPKGDLFLSMQYRNLIYRVLGVWTNYGITRPGRDWEAELKGRKWLSLGARAPGNRWEHLRNIVGTGTLCLWCNHQTHVKDICNVPCACDLHIPTNHRPITCQMYFPFLPRLSHTNNQSVHFDPSLTVPTVYPCVTCRLHYAGTSGMYLDCKCCTCFNIFPPDPYWSHCKCTQEMWLKCSQPLNSKHILDVHGCCSANVPTNNRLGTFYMFLPVPCWSHLMDNHLLLEMSRLHVPIPVPPNHLPSMNEVPKIEIRVAEWGMMGTCQPWAVLICFPLWRNNTPSFPLRP